MVVLHLDVCLSIWYVRLQAREVMVTDVVFFGLKKVMPLMTEGLLQFPSLATQYFSLVSYSSLYHPVS